MIDTMQEPSLEATQPLLLDTPLSTEPEQTDLGDAVQTLPRITSAPLPIATSPSSPEPENSMNTAADPVTGSGSESTSNGNLIAILSTVDLSTNVITYTYQVSVNMITNNTTTYNTTVSESTTRSDQELISSSEDAITGISSEISSEATSLRFRFDSRAYFRANGNRRIDRIMDFSIENGDKVELSRRVFKGIGDLEFQSVSSAKQLKRAAKTDADILYNTSTSRIYFNANGEDKGFGARGGLFAVFEGAPLITANEFILI